MKLHVVGTGSSGNNYLLISDDGSVLMLDAGMRYSDIQKALSFDISKVTGALVSHAHLDHCKAVPDLLKAGIPVYMSPGTRKAVNAKLDPMPIDSDEDFYSPFTAGEWQVRPFKTIHDAVEPVGFLLADRRMGYKILYATDTHYIKYVFTGLNFIIIECNFITDTLLQNIEAGRIPGALKDRLLHSHMSLEIVKDFLRATDLSQCLKIVLVHLSDSNSDAARMVREIHGQTGIETIAAEKGMDIPFDLFPF